MPKQYPDEVRRRAARLVVEHRGEYETEYEAIRSVAAKLGIGSAETLRKWLRQTEVDAGARPDVYTEESAELGRPARSRGPCWPTLRETNSASCARRRRSSPEHGLIPALAARGESTRFGAAAFCKLTASSTRSQSSPPESAFAGFRFPAEVIVVTGATSPA
jgi:transposase